MKQKTYIQSCEKRVIFFLAIFSFILWVTQKLIQKFVPLRWRHNDHAGVSNHQPHGCLLNRLFRRKSKKTSKLRVTGLCAGNSPGTGEFPAQMASYAENVSIWWRHHVKVMSVATLHQLGIAEFCVRQESFMSFNYTPSVLIGFDPLLKSLWCSVHLQNVVMYHPTRISIHVELNISRWQLNSDVSCLLVKQIDFALEFVFAIRKIDVLIICLMGSYP